MVKLNNMTQSVDNNLCEDARLPTPVTIQKCETDDCPQWTVTEWKPCEESKCFTWNTGTCEITENNQSDHIDRAVAIILSRFRCRDDGGAR
jgi:hypothetical protein